tara:strand:- start:1076 stop:1666 length:591 start_codon:yes stop_codon:yes gene_type:complete
MYRKKIKIKSNKLSWEESNKILSCDKKNCKLEGKYKAPKSKINLRDYYFFCLKHVKEYNKSWDYYRGMSVSQIELSLRQDVIWNRPSWPTKGSSRIIGNIMDNIVKNDYIFINNDQKSNKSFNYNMQKENLTLNERMCVKKLQIQLPITLEKLKHSYKKLVKKYHPDINKDDNNAEKIFKEVNSAYKVLLKKILNN